MRRRYMRAALMLPAFCCLILCGCSSPARQIYAGLLAPIELPDRSQAKTVADFVDIILADEEVIAAKNADLAALRAMSQ